MNKPKTNFIVLLFKYLELNIIIDDNNVIIDKNIG